MHEFYQTNFYIILGIMAAAAFGLTLLFGRIALPILRAKKAGQPINEYVTAHQSKAGTPTMGGISFVPAFLAVMLAFCVYFVLTYGTYWAFELIPVALVCLYGLAHAAIGFVDDYFKLLRRHNEGLTEKQKLLLQVVAAAAFVAMMAITGKLTTELHIPFTDIRWDLGWFAYPVYILVMVGFVNATNITDGLDGLASGCMIIAALAFLCILPWIPELTPFLMAIVAACAGFLWFNCNPARVFMGDTGSLALGGALGTVAVCSGLELILVVIGGVFVAEALSVMLQVGWFKFTRIKYGEGRRIFRMAPIHHHFEKGGLSETQVCIRFWIVAGILAFVGIALFYSCMGL